MLYLLLCYYGFINLVEAILYSFIILFYRNHGATVVWHDVRTSAGTRPVLRGVSGAARPGGVLAVLGPSGGGKTTLLDVLAGRRRAEAGLVTLNGERLCKRWRRHICYVLQQDIFFPNLTLRETLDYTAALR